MPKPKAKELRVRTAQLDELNLEGLMRNVRREGEMRKSRDWEVEDFESSEKRQRIGNKVFRGNCYSCGKPGHYLSNCPDKGVFFDSDDRTIKYLVDLGLFSKTLKFGKI